MHRNHAILVPLMTAASAAGGVVSWEATSYPETQGWERDIFCTPERWLDPAGWYFQEVAPGCGDPPPGDRESFSRSLADFQDEEEFFIEWSVETDGDRSEIIGVAPAALSASGTSGVLYHFTIARDQVRFIRMRHPMVFIDIQPEVPHTYRVELYGDELYIWYIDGKVIEQGMPEGPFPKSDSRLHWRGRSWRLENTVWWDYIRYGTIPEEASGDYDSDEDVDLDDYYYVHECFSQSGPGVDAGPGCRFADFDGDSDVDFKDLAAFQNAFTD